MDTRYKGFQLATLTHEKHHTEFITVPWGSKDYVPNCQYAFDLYATGTLPPKNTLHSLYRAVLSLQIAETRVCDGSVPSGACCDDDFDAVAGAETLNDTD